MILPPLIRLIKRVGGNDDDDDDTSSQKLYGWSDQVGLAKSLLYRFRINRRHAGNNDVSMAYAIKICLWLN